MWPYFDPISWRAKVFSDQTDGAEEVAPVGGLGGQVVDQHQHHQQRQRQRQRPPPPPPSPSRPTTSGFRRLEDKLGKSSQNKSSPAAQTIRSFSLFSTCEHAWSQHCLHHDRHYQQHQLQKRRGGRTAPGVVGLLFTLGFGLLFTWEKFRKGSPSKYEIMKLGNVASELPT